MSVQAKPTAGTSSGSTSPQVLGVVVIGRNEGQRLRRCLESVLGATPAVVYVDSGSSDGSAAMAAALGADMVALDLARPFTAARARNEGLARLRGAFPAATRVQFVDGDCEVVAGWLASAERFLDAHPEVAVVCGRRRERHPERSVYNLLCDLEWDTPVGAAKAFGGDAMLRIDALRQVGGYRDDLVAGEEPELAVRLRARGWKIHRLDAEMTLHDAAITRFGQWWTRSVRAGFAFAEGARLHGAPPERHWVRETRSAWLWGAAIPLAAPLLALAVGPWGLALFALYPLQVLRLGLRGNAPARARWARALFIVLGKFAEVRGQIRWAWRHARRQPAALIEYK